jgi:acetolactate synthase-1/2/3 large subunit
MKVADLVSKFLIEKGITHGFSVTGGFAMHLNDSFGQTMNIVYTHGENPAGYAAVGWAKAMNAPCMACVTAGCGATNALTPCLIAYQDSTPVIFISGGVPYKESVRTLCHSTRTYSGSDCDIIDMVRNITKYAVEFTPTTKFGTELDVLYWHMTHGRPGPVWLSIPLDVQPLETDDTSYFVVPSTCPKQNDFPMDAWETSQRPVILIGNGIHLSNTSEALEKFVEKHQVPVVASYFGTDLAPEYNIGRVGILGDRSGNMTLQNADFVLCLGCRVSKAIVGYRPEWFCREATVVRIDVEPSDTSYVIQMDLRDFFATEQLSKKECTGWLAKTREWKQKWSRELPNPGSPKCPYNFLHNFFNLKPAGEACVTSSGSIFCASWHQYLAKPGDRYILSSHGDMGFEVPASIGAAWALGKPVWSIVGDGSFQLNLQEVQTILTYKIPVKILYFNNGGYGAIQITQDQYFKRRFGVDIECPKISKICNAYDLVYFTGDQIEAAIAHEGPCLVEIVCNVQQRHPRLMNKMNPDGTFQNTPMEDMYPFLDREEFRVNMFVKEV